MIEIAKSEGRPYSAACVDAIQRVCTLSDNTFAGVKGSMQVPLMPWANPRVDAATSANDFDLRDVRRKKMTIYLGITPNKLAEAKNIINIFFDQLINLNTRVLPQQDKSLKYQCLLILDEFTAIGKVNQIAQSISYQAGYNMRVLTIIQNKSQLEDVYGKPGALTLMSNHALMVIYTPSPVVQQDANEYSEMLGYETVKSTSKSRSYGKQGSTSDSTSDQKRALMLPQELKEMDMWEEIVSLEHTKPIKCGKIKYFEDPTFTSRINHPLPEGCEIPLIDLDEFSIEECKYQRAERQKRNSLIKTLYLPEGILDAKLESFDTNSESRKIIYKHITEYGLKKDNSTFDHGLYLYGTFAIGKTYALAVIANELSKRNVPSLLIYFPDLVLDLKGAIGTNRFEELINMLKDIEVLMLDDLGSENMTPWLRDEIIGPIINYRMMAKKPIYFSSNLNPNDLKKHLAIDDSASSKLKADRILSRLTSLAEVLNMDDSTFYNR